MLQTTSGQAKVGAVLSRSLPGGEEGGTGDEVALPPMDTDSAVLDSEDICQLRDRLPNRLENTAWTLAFSTARDGFSLSQLYRKTQDLDCPVLLVIQDVDQFTFGGLLSEPPKVTESFCGEWRNKRHP